MVKVVIIGGSYAGHKALTAVYKKAKDLLSLEVTLVSASSHAYFNVATPRLLVKPELYDKAIFANSDLVATNSKKAAKFVHGTVEKVDLDARTVRVLPAEGEGVNLDYDILVIASGSGTKWSGFKVNTDYKKGQAELLAASSQLKTAKSVALIGSGPTGVETAGEIAENFPDVVVSLYSGNKAPLESEAPSLAPFALQKLQDLGVKIIHGDHVTSKDGKVFTDDGELTAYDVILECYATRPYSDFLPGSIKDDKGYVVTDENLVVKGHANVLAIGDIVSGSANTVVDIKMRQAGVFAASVQKALESTISASESIYKPITNLILVPISSKGGVGLFFGWWTPNIFVWFLKARDFMLNQAGSQFQ